MVARRGLRSRLHSSPRMRVSRHSPAYAKSPLGAAWCVSPGAFAGAPKIGAVQSIPGTKATKLFVYVLQHVLRCMARCSGLSGCSNCCTDHASLHTKARALLCSSHAQTANVCELIQTLSTLVLSLRVSAVSQASRASYRARQRARCISPVLACSCFTRHACGLRYFNNL